MPKTFIVLHVPALHRGYVDFFRRHASADGVYVIGQDLLEEFGVAGKEIRALDPETAKTLIEGLRIFPHIAVLEKAQMQELIGATIVAAKEKILEDIVRKYFPKNEIVFDTAFLRWDESLVKSGSDVKYDRISHDPFDREMVARAANESEKSSDWWRHVGAVLVKDGNVVLEAHNAHVPTEEAQYIDGDPRDFIEAGTHREFSAGIHAEQQIVGEAARRGIPLEGTRIYMNVFPCNVCAQLAAAAGIKKCFFVSGNAYLRVEEIFRAAGVEIVKVE